MAVDDHSREISPKTPTVEPGSTHAIIHFAGRVVSLKAYKPGNDGPLIATFDPQSVSSPRESAMPSGASGQGQAGNADGSAQDPNSDSSISAKVFQNFVKKCEQNNAKSCEMVGFDMEQGWGTAKDPKVAKEYYAKACSLGRKSACGR